MKIGIQRLNENIVTVKDYSDIHDRGEISHIMAELESIRWDLLELWESYDETEEDDETE